MCVTINCIYHRTNKSRFPVNTTTMQTSGKVWISRVIYLTIIAIWAKAVNSEEFNSSNEYGSKLFGVATNYTPRVIPTENRTIKITVLESNMDSALENSALTSLSHNAQLYLNNQDKLLWYTCEEMNYKHSRKIWLGAVNYMYVIGNGPYLIVTINNDLFFLFGVQRC
ncbi:hypothetical protein Trydic_g1064 [Trypoxylus dichotomus]